MATERSSPVVHIALLRGINVGKAKRVAMADLRSLCEGLGYGEVKTLLNSGNIIFSAPRADAKAAAKIQKEILSQIGVSCRVLVLTAAELDRVVEENTLVECETNPSRFQVTILANAADRARIAPLAMQNWGTERLGVGSLAAYLWCPNGSLESRSAAAVWKALGDAATSRNWATIRKLQALASAAATAR